MPENSQSQLSVLIASSLKPAKDVRAWEKLGKSLRETTKYKVNIIGFSAKKIEKLDGVNFYSSYASGRSRWDRIKALGRFTQLLLKIKPEILICCTYEYLPVARFFKKAMGYKLVYDVQENYVANLDLNPLLGKDKKARLKKLIHWMEKKNGIDLHLLAESCYQFEMPDKSPFLVLENKFSGEIRPRAALNLGHLEEFHFLISGTLTPAYGTIDGINWFKKILEFYPKSSLKIIGHVPLDFYRKEIQKLANSDPQIQLELSEFPVPYTHILEAYQDANFLLLPYQNAPAFQDKIPTKLFEAAALAVPVLISPNPNWKTFLEKHESGFSMDFSNSMTPLEDFQVAISKTYFSKSPDNSLSWSSQEQAFLQAISSLF